jgi:hypothetical protein
MYKSSFMIFLYDDINPIKYMVKLALTNEKNIYSICLKNHWSF